MIIIKAIKDEGGIKPERSLTQDEWATVTSVLSNGEEYIYYQGDEPIQELN